MNKDFVISVENVGKKFCRSLKRGLIYGAKDLASDFFSTKADRSNLRPDEFWALKDVNFGIRKGETLGFIGVNGSGKSTLLRLIAGIYTPDLGKVSVKGRVGVLIALGAGFHPHMSGLENIYLNASILGLSKAEIDSKLDEIIEFSELKEFIHAPVSTYSSGMTVRLGFSIASHCDADILLVDEVLAVGDLAFTLKCYRKMANFRKNGGTTILVSHSNQLIRNVCDRVIWLDKGVMKIDGPAQEVCDEYEKTTTASLVETYSGQTISNDSTVQIERIETLDDNGTPSVDFEVSKGLIVRVHYSAERRIQKPIFSITFENLENVVVAANFSSLDGIDFPPIDGKGYVEIKIPKLQLKRGRYFLSFTLAENEINNTLAWLERTHHIAVFGGPVSYGIFNPFPIWQDEKK